MMLDSPRQNAIAESAAERETAFADSLPQIRVRAPTVWDIGYLCHNMRTDEIEQFMAFAPMDEYDPDKATRMFLGVRGPTFLYADRDDLPILVGGFEPILTGVHNCWMAGTMAGWDRYGIAITRKTKRIMDQMMARPEFHRMQIPVLATRIGAQAWYARGLGMQYEGTLRKYGKNGEDFVMYSRVKSDEQETEENRYG